VKLLLVHPGADTSTHDVFTGLHGALKARGHECYEYALDARISRSGAWLNYCWQKGGKTLDKPTPGDILYHAGEELVARALRIMPDCVLVVSAMYLHPDVAVLLHRARLNTAILFTESPYDDERQERLMPFVKVAWTNERTSLKPRFPHLKYLPHAWNADVHVADGVTDDDVPSHQVVFIGTCFEERVDLFRSVDWTGIDLALYGNWSEQLGSRNRLRKYVRGGYVDNARTAMLYRKAAIGLNLYRTSKGFGKGVPHIARAESLNPRAYELAATGCFTVSDYRAEVPEVFGDLVPTFEKPEDLQPLLRRWLADAEGLARARAALPGTVAQHTWHERARQIETDLQGAGIGAGHAVQLSIVGRQAGALTGG
jgi:hypothetical protein